jgi:hypothetical protein
MARSRVAWLMVGYGVLTALFRPALTAYIPELVQPDRLAAANALFSALRQEELLRPRCLFEHANQQHSGLHCGEGVNPRDARRVRDGVGEIPGCADEPAPVLI